MIEALKAADRKALMATGGRSHPAVEADVSGSPARAHEFAASAAGAWSERARARRPAEPYRHDGRVALAAADPLSARRTVWHLLGRFSARGTEMNDSDRADLPLPRGIRSRFVADINGLTMHVLEAGSEQDPCLLLLHGFPELAYSWRKVMLPLASAGFHVVAPDQRGYGRTTGWESGYDCDLMPFRMLNVVKDALALVFALGRRSVSAVIGHDFGSPVAAYCALARPDVFRSVVMMSAPFPGPPSLRFGAGAWRSQRLDGAARCSRRSRGAAAAAQALSLVLFDARSRRRHAERRAGHSCVPARLLSSQERRLEGRTGPSGSPHGAPTSWPSCRPTTSWIWRKAWRRPSRPKCLLPPRSPHALAHRGRLARLQRRICQHRVPGRPELVSLPTAGKPNADLDSSPAAPSTSRPASSREQATGASTRSPAIWSDADTRLHADARAVIWCREPATGCSRRSPRRSRHCCWVSCVPSRSFEGGSRRRALCAPATDLVRFGEPAQHGTGICAAGVEDDRAARMERASARRIERARDFAPHLVCAVAAGANASGIAAINPRV